MRQRPEFLKRGQPVRLQAFLARSGVSSRRGAEEMIAHGRVSVNGKTVTVMGTTVRPGVDRVALDGEEVKVAPTTWIALHKPRGYVTSRADPFGRRTVYELLPEKYHGLFHVGRLDRDSEGILLLTNDGELANRLLHPSFGVTKEYDVVAAGKPSDAALRQLVEGVELEDGVAKAESAKLLGPAGNGLSRVKIVLREGKKREVRRMLEALGHPVRRLIRRRFGPITLAELPSGKYRVVAPEELSEGHAPRRAAREAAARPDAPERPKRGAAEARPKRSAVGVAKGRPAAGEDRPKRAPARGGRPPARGGDEAPPRRTPALRGRDSAPERADGAERPAVGRGSRSGEDRPKRTPARGGKPPARGGDEAPARRTAPPRGASSRPREEEAERPRRERTSRPAEDRPEWAPARGGKRPVRGGDEAPARRTSGSRGRDSAPERSDAPERPKRGGPARPGSRGGKPGGGKPGAKPGPRGGGSRPPQKRGGGKRP